MHRYSTVLIAIMAVSACAQAHPPATPATAMPAAEVAAAAPSAAPASAAQPASEPAVAAQPAAAAQPEPRAAAIADAEPDVTQQISAILEKVRAGMLTPEEMTDNARTAYPASQLQRMAGAMRPCSKPPVLELLARTTKGEDRSYRYRALCPTPLMVEIVFNKGGRINHLSVQPETLTR